MVKNPSAMRETWVPALGQEDHLKEGMATPGPSLENPTDRGAWQAAVHRVAKSRTQLKRLGIYNSITYILLVISNILKFLK